MRVIVSDFISLDGVVQAPGAQGEDTDGAFAHGGWSMPYFDPDTMGPRAAARFVDDDRHRRPDLHVPTGRPLNERSCQTALWHPGY